HQSAAIRFIGERVEAQRRAQLYRELVQYVHVRGGWPTSIPGSSTLTFDAVSGEIAGDLRAVGYTVHEAGQSERAGGVARKEEFRNARGEVVQTVLHSGICKVRQFALEVPGSNPLEPNNHAGAPRPRTPKKD